VRYAIFVGCVLVGALGTSCGDISVAPGTGQGGTSGDGGRGAAAGTGVAGTGAAGNGAAGTGVAGNGVAGTGATGVAGTGATGVAGTGSTGAAGTGSTGAAGTSVAGAGGRGGGSAGTNAGAAGTIAAGGRDGGAAGTNAGAAGTVAAGGRGGGAAGTNAGVAGTIAAGGRGGGAAGTNPGVAGAAGRGGAGGGGGACRRELLTNGDFELASTAWNEAPLGTRLIRRADDAEIAGQQVTAQSGAFVVRLGAPSTNNYVVHYIEQYANIPSNAREVTISGHVQVRTQEPADDIYDVAYVRLFDESMPASNFFRNTPPWSNLTAASGWTAFSFPVDVASIAGREMVFRIVADLDTSVPTYFFFDTVSITVTRCSP
jgi:hypothetical protein